MKKGVFIEKDGTLLVDVPYNVDPAFIQFNDTVPEALSLLQDEGYELIIVSSQPGIALNYFTAKEMSIMEEVIRQRLEESGIDLAGFYYCPHHPHGKNRIYSRSCGCRKPQPGLILQAAEELHIDLEESWMIGDVLHNVEAGNRANCKTIFLDNGNEVEWDINEWRKPTHIVQTLAEAASYICSANRKPSRMFAPQVRA